MITKPNVKINLGLHVLSRRSDGFHEIETLFVPYFGIHDRLEIIPAGSGSETACHIEEIYAGTATRAVTPDGKVTITIARRQGVDWDPLKDLSARAYALLDEEFHLPPVEIFLEKTSPVGAGLGGGSADAAFALRMLSEIFSLGLSDDDLALKASRLGSDCAFFAFNRPMTGRGRGEILNIFDTGSLFEDYEIRVVVPEGIHVSTADAYRGITPRKRGPQEGLEEVLRHPVAEWKDLLVNDFEATVFSKYPALAAAKQDIYDSGAVYAAMSGSGSALFGLFKK